MKKTAYFLVALIIISAMSITSLASEHDLRTVSTLDADTLREYMHPESRHLAEDVVRICAEQQISAEFIAAVMRWERRPDLHNWFGWTGNNGRLMSFSSDLECLERIIPIIKKNYLTADGKYFNGYTVDAVSIFYNNSDFWRDTISAEVTRILKNSTPEPSPSYIILPCTLPLTIDPTL
ncbi:MAG: hypothetical protein IJC94_00805 [Oscillospiraceae bacterium]|nr:hypothetical protein [Oscillospiraceae bacterium]